MNKKDYVKITYESDPIGKYGIVLQLRTFDVEAYERDQKLKQIPIKTEAKRLRLDEVSRLEDPLYLFRIQEQINKFVVDTYEQQILDLKRELEYARSIRTIPDTHEYYIVQEGDTLWDIANIYETTWEHLAKINGIKNPDLIYPGQHIYLR